MNHHQQEELQSSFEVWAREEGYDPHRYADSLGRGYWGEENTLFAAYKAAWNRRAAPTEPAVDRDALILVRAAAKDMYNKTFAEKRLRLSSHDKAVRDAAVSAGEVLVAALKATEHLAAPVAPAVPKFKDHNIRQLVNDLRDIATTFRATGQLRERIAGAVQQFLATPATSPSPSVDQAKRLVGGEVAADPIDADMLLLKLREAGILNSLAVQHLLNGAALELTLPELVDLVRASTGSATSTD